MQRYEYQFKVGSATFPPEADRSISGIQKFVQQKAKEGYRLVFLQRLIGSDDFFAVLERPVLREP